MEHPACPKCGGKSSKYGFALRKGGKVQSYKCTNCGHVFVEKKSRTAIIGTIVAHPKTTAEKGETITT